MIIKAIEKEFKEKVCEQIRLYPEGINRYKIFSPFMFDDGDHLVIVLKNEDNKWILSDEGHTFMHLTYSNLDLRDIQKGTRQKIINNTLQMFGIEDRKGELIIGIENNNFGDSLYSFVQALIKITDIAYLSRERIVSTFIEDLYAFLSDSVPENRRKFDWNEPKLDPEGKYIVDCRINGNERPIFLFGLSSDDKVLNATINLLKFEQWGLKFRSVGIFEDQSEINRKVLAKFSDVCEKQFSSLYDNKDRIQRYIQYILAES